MSSFEVRDDRNIGIIFIHSELDDYGLDPFEFRIYCHIARRVGSPKKGQDKGCWESIVNIAKRCKMNDKTVRKALAFLEDRRLITVTQRPGHTSLMTLNDTEDWLPCDRATPTKSGTTKNGIPPLPNQVAPVLPKTEGLPLPNQVDKVNPIEINPIEINPIKSNTPLTPQGGIAEEELPFSIWEEPENPEPEQAEIVQASEDFSKPAPLAISSSVGKISPAAAKKSKPSDADFNIFCDRWNEQKGTWAGCELSRTTGTFSSKRLKGFRKAWEEHGDRLMEKFDLACEFIRTNQWHIDNPFSIDTLLVEGKITKYSDDAIARRANPVSMSSTIQTKNLSHAELHEQLRQVMETHKQAKSGAAA